jgi:hypothetical protein
LSYTARTPEEHRALASYFRNEAQLERKSEQRYLDAEMNYRLHPLRADFSRNIPTAEYYRSLAAEAEGLAFADETLAKYHDRLANPSEPSK